uniref:Uncharacterized protein n=1 Tax=Coccidioides posadasii RMSCC 3488 TaxID=454284 RepID=A0A0J6EWF6_COCPO|nr:hypothetical protein CPAG_01243 [Coccidioides posadasii RMSCC 3488]
MPSSTVFSYLRRDHRRPSPSPATASPASHASSQLPATATTADSIFGTGPCAGQKTDTRAAKPTEPTKGIALKPVSSTPSLRPVKPIARPHSSSGESVGPLSSLTNTQKPNHLEIGLQKGISSWKRSFGGQKAAAGPGVSTGGAGKGKAPDPAAGAPSLQIRDAKPESSLPRRDGGYDSMPEQPSSRGGRMRLHLLNPMTLLARRRSAQLGTRAEDINIGKLTLPALPDDYDPRIRGKLFHDFSTPRGRPNHTSSHAQAAYSWDSRVSSGHGEEGYFSDSSARASRRSRQPEHKPVFKENFDDENPDTRDIQERPSATENQSYSVPVFARDLPLSLPPQPEPELSPETPSPPSTTAQDETPSSLRSRPSTVRDPSSQAPSGLPKHLTSSASRFSFDIPGGDSASQERLLEEKHKEKEAARKAKEQSNPAADFESEEFDYDAMMDADGLEEMIPGVNADADEYEGEDVDSNAVKPLKPLATPSTFLLSPVSSEGAPSSQVSQLQDAFSMHGVVRPNADTTPTPTTVPSLTIDTNQALLAHAPQVLQADKNLDPPYTMGHDDDLYYDDGLFGDLPEEMQSGNFDESIFDDEASHLYARKSSRDNALPSLLEKQPSSSKHGTDRQKPLPPAKDVNENFGDKSGPLSDKSSSEGLQESAPVLTHGNLQAYHDALAQAANEAVRRGRFQRSPGGSEASGNHDGTEESHPELTADESRHTSENVEMMAVDGVSDEFDFYDADDIDDDPMIAAANAEALENDDEGFYGQEFGFYAHSHPHCESERTFGGYFGTMGLEGIKRKHSARANFQEPSLTPITERSEWSTRNSIVSLAPHASHHSNPSNPSLSSPPLSQLLDMGHLDDELSLSALMKLRRGAFGGSNGSLRSNATSQAGQSPQPASAPAGSNFGSFPNLHNILPDQKRASTVMNSPMGLSSPPLVENGELAVAGLSLRNDIPLRLRSSERPHSMNLDLLATGKAKSPEVIRRHLRSNSATESISYVKETDGLGANRWVLERRRTGADGEGELVEREVMSSGHI